MRKYPYHWRVLAGLAPTLFLWGYLHIGHNPFRKLARTPTDKVELFPIIQNGKWGYMDRTGKIIIAPRFSKASVFSEGVAHVDQGLIDSLGQVVLDARELSRRGIVLLGDFSEGMIGITQSWENMGINPSHPPPNVSLGGATLFAFGYMDRSGHIAIKPAYAGAHAFSDGLAAVNVRGSIEYIDHNGSVALGAPYNPSYDFSEGLAAAQITGMWGFIDRSGQVAISPKYRTVGRFSEGLARVATEVPRQLLWTFIDHAGQQIILTPFQDADDFSEGLAAVRQNGLWGFIDKTGAWAIQPTFTEQPGKFSMGLSQIRQGKDVYYIDASGRAINPHSRG